MLDENILYSKINTLQVKMIKFHEEMSPVKTREAEQALVQYDEDSKFLSICAYIATGFLKILVCIVGPTLFPAIVYCVEGSSQLFWQVTAVSCVITLLSAMMIVTVLCLNVKMVYARIKQLLKSLGSLCGNGGFSQSLWEALSSDFLKMNIHKISYPVTLLLVGGLLSYATYTKNNWVGFYASLVTVGFICGILTAAICNILRSPELLPLHSPYKIRMELATPTRQVKKELEFSESPGPDPSVPTPRLLTPHTALVEENPQLPATPTTSVLGNYASAISHGEVEGTKMYQLPINFGKFLRALQS